MLTQDIQETQRRGTKKERETGREREQGSSGEEITSDGRRICGRASGCA